MYSTGSRAPSRRSRKASSTRTVAAAAGACAAGPSLPGGSNCRSTARPFGDLGGPAEQGFAGAIEKVRLPPGRPHTPHRRCCPTARPKRWRMHPAASRPSARLPADGGARTRPCPARLNCTASQHVLDVVFGARVSCQLQQAERMGAAVAQRYGDPVDTRRAASPAGPHRQGADAASADPAPRLIARPVAHTSSPPLRQGQPRSLAPAPTGWPPVGENCAPARRLR